MIKQRQVMSEGLLLCWPCSDLGWIPSQTILYLWWRKWHWDMFLFQYFSFPVSIIPPLLNISMSVICYRLCIILAADIVVINKDM